MNRPKTSIITNKADASPIIYPEPSITSSRKQLIGNVNRSISLNRPKSSAHNTNNRIGSLVRNAKNRMNQTGGEFKAPNIRITSAVTKSPIRRSPSKKTNKYHNKLNDSKVTAENIEGKYSQMALNLSHQKNSVISAQNEPLRPNQKVTEIKGLRKRMEHNYPGLAKEEFPSWSSGNYKLTERSFGKPGEEISDPGISQQHLNEFKSVDFMIDYNYMVDLDIWMKSIKKNDNVDIFESVLVSDLQDQVAYSMEFNERLEIILNRVNLYIDAAKTALLKKNPSEAVINTTKQQKTMILKKPDNTDQICPIINEKVTIKAYSENDFSNYESTERSEPTESNTGRDQIPTTDRVQLKGYDDTLNKSLENQHVGQDNNDQIPINETCHFAIPKYSSNDGNNNNFHDKKDVEIAEDVPKDSGIFKENIQVQVKKGPAYRQKKMYNRFQTCNEFENNTDKGNSKINLPSINDLNALPNNNNLIDQVARNQTDNSKYGGISFQGQNEFAFVMKRNRTVDKDTSENNKREPLTPAKNLNTRESVSVDLKDIEHLQTCISDKVEFTEPNQIGNNDGQFNKKVSVRYSSINVNIPQKNGSIMSLNNQDESNKNNIRNQKQKESMSPVNRKKMMIGMMGGFLLNKTENKDENGEMNIARRVVVCPPIQAFSVDRKR